MEWKGEGRNGMDRSGKDWRGLARYYFKSGTEETKKMTKKYEVEITGVTPLLQNKPEEYGFDVEWVEKKATNDKDKEMLQKLYVDSDGVIYEPATHLERAIIEAGKKLKMKGAGKATYSKIFGSMVSVSPEAIPHIVDKFEKFTALVVIPSTKGRVARHRPMFKDWKLQFVVEAEDEIPASVLKEALEIAGKYSGIGDWRPEKKGKFGKFQVTSFHEV